MKKMTTEQSEQSREHLQVEWLLFFPRSMKMHNSWLEITKSCHSTLKSYRRHERKVGQSLFVSIEINSTIAKVTVWHNWLNRVRLA